MLSDCVPTCSVKPDKDERNKKYLEKMNNAPKEIVLISCCDKIHNLRTMVSDYDIIGIEFWNKFSKSPVATVDNYHKLEMVYADRLGNHRVIKTYKKVLTEFEALLPK